MSSTQRGDLKWEITYCCVDKMIIWILWGPECMFKVWAFSYNYIGFIEKKSQFVNWKLSLIVSSFLHYQIRNFYAFFYWSKASMVVMGIEPKIIALGWVIFFAALVRSATFDSWNFPQKSKFFVTMSIRLVTVCIMDILPMTVCLLCQFA